MSKAKYVKKDQIEHILDRPDMYVGSIQLREYQDYVVSNQSPLRISKQKINISPGIIRMFIEPLSNVIDNVARSKQNKNPTTKIEITIKDNEITFWNDGDIIPVEMHPTEECYNHTLIFGHLLTSSNYDDQDDDRLDVSGRNGLGVKLVSVFSKTFSVEGDDPVNKKRFSQTWNNNMRNPSEPKVIPRTGKFKGYTKVSYILDFERFGLTGYTEDILKLYHRFVIDAAMITRVPVIFNGEEIHIETLLDYAKLFTGESNEEESNEESDEEESNEDGEKKQNEWLHVKTADCEVVLLPNTTGEEQIISFANGIYTPLGGTHVDAWSETIFRPIVDKLNKESKSKSLNLKDVKRFFFLFIVATVKRPAYDAQTKTKLESPTVVAEIKASHINKIMKWSSIEQIEEIVRIKELALLKKNEKKKRGYEHVEGHERANKAGGKSGHECTLILVEGLSARTYAVDAVSKGVDGKVGRDWFGIMCLIGKVLNVRNNKAAVIAKSKPVTNIIKALGLQFDVDYTIEENYRKLQYGRIMILTDADLDGIHISGLVQNMFHYLFPTLLQRSKPFIVSVQTPIVRVNPNKKNSLLFYSEDEYKKYVKDNDGKKIDKKYYKGLGASTTKDVIETFGQKMIEFVPDEKMDETITHVFNDKYADVRKNWMDSCNLEDSILKWHGSEEERLNVKYSDFANKEMLKFSIRNCQRSIPSLLDGLKESQRKVLFYCLKKNVTKSIKLAQLIGYIASETNYHHGENSLVATLHGMATSFIGSNNIPLFIRDGQYGSRSQGGKDAAQPRYVHTHLEKITRYIFRSEDDCILKYIEEDGDSIEPEHYIPILPMILVNGAEGIGTGWSSKIPCYNPLDLVNAVKIWLDNDGKIFEQKNDMVVSLLPEMKPWYRGYTGEIIPKEDNKYISWGKLEKVSDDTVRVTELPIGLWTCNFKKRIEKMRENKEVDSIDDQSGAETVDFTISGLNGDEEKIKKKLKLYKSVNTTNMVLFSAQGLIRKYKDVDEIIDSFCKTRLAFYTKRKNARIKYLEPIILLLKNKKRFLEEIRDGEIRLFEEKGKSRLSRGIDDIVKDLEKRGYIKDNEESETKHGYEYLLRLQIGNITSEKIRSLQAEIDQYENELTYLRTTSEREIWEKELDEFVVAYEQWLADLEREQQEIEAMIKKQKTKPKTVRRKKAT